MSLNYYYSERDRYQGKVNSQIEEQKKYIEKQEKYKELKANLDTAIAGAGILQTETSAVVSAIGSAAVSGGKGFGEEDLTKQSENMRKVASNLTIIADYCQTQIENLQEWYIDKIQVNIDNDQAKVDEYQRKIDEEEARIAQEEAASRKRAEQANQSNNEQENKKPVLPPGKKSILERNFIN